MNKQWLLMKYHPAKKEVEFHRYINNEKIAIPNDSRLMYYMNMRGKFVLQDHGNTFFDDIAKAFNGVKSVDIKVITTRLDFEDLEQMVEYYNNSASGRCRINVSLKAELPNMAQTFSEVKTYGRNAIGILQGYRQKLYNLPLENEYVRESVRRFATQIDVEAGNIQEKIESLSDNNVSLCVTGVYSAGKSALINALLGYRILPEAVTSETAKMFKIYSPKDNEPIQIEFDILGIASRLEWDNDSNCFEFSLGPAESVIRTEIQKKMNACQEAQKKLYEQLRELLADLNARKDISSDISIKFPVALDTENVQFTIYDTPGTDSNYLDHQTILNEALAEQTQSILIFVAHPTKLEGEGNNALLNYLKAAEKKSSKTSIDIGRSLFVMNYADTITSEVRETLRYNEIKSKDDENFSIKLSDKKLLFTSARYAYAAKAVRNGIATSEEDMFNEMGKMMFSNEVMPYSLCYRQNHCASSDVATERMMRACDQALKEARNAKDDSRTLIITSGLYALEREIVLYGEKYASAVKAFAIIDSVDKALTNLSKKADMLHKSNQQEISTIEENINELRMTIDKAINDSYDKISIPVGTTLPEETRKCLHLDAASLNKEVIGPAKTRMNNLLRGWFFGHGTVLFKESHIDKIKNSINAVLDDFTDKFKDGRETTLEQQRDNFMQAIKAAIIENGNISDDAKQYFLDIPAPQISLVNQMRDVGDIYNSYKRTNKIFFFTAKRLDKRGFISEIEEQLLKISRNMVDEYETDYRDTLDILLNQIRTQFRSNLEDYSLNMHALICNREAMKELGGQVSEAADALECCKQNLNNIIWRETPNA